MSNPWREHRLESVGSSVRFMLWACFAACGLCLAIFCFAFTLEFLIHLWDFLNRTLFASPWGMSE